MSDSRVALPSRRALMTAAIGAAAATVAQTIGRPLAIRAADGDPVIAGQEVTASETTTIRNTSTDSPVFVARTDGAGVAVAGLSSGSASAGVQGSADGENASGVYGSSVAGTGVSGLGDHFVGVMGRSTNAVGVYGDSASNDKPAIIGRAQGGATGIVGFSGESQAPVPDGPLDTGVFGYSVGNGLRPPADAIGVYGLSASGTGVYARADTSGTALRVNGKAIFSRSGTVQLATGASKVSKSVTGLTSSSLVFAVVRSGDGDVWVRKVLPANGKFTVHMNKSVSSPTMVTWIAFG